MTAYLEETLDVETRLRFEEHLAACPPCRDYLEQMRLGVRLARSLGGDPLSATGRADLLRAFREGRE